MNDELKKIKKYYGEEMMHFCRENFSTLFEEEGTVLSILENNFAHSHELFSDIKEEEKEYYFKNYIYSFYDVEEKQMITKKTPFELMEEAGYILYECKSEEEIQSFKKYYKHQEELCTFHGNRLQTNYVFFAIKKNVDEIKREDFSKPKRQDKYGTSVISIQFTRGEVNTLSIKNRYNHTVNNPDATFSNNLENIIPGLTDSFEREYGFTINQNKNGFELDHYVVARDGKLYKYNYEVGNIYYGPNNIVIDRNRNVMQDFLSKEKYLIFDYYVLDIVNKKIGRYPAYLSQGSQSFLELFQNIEKIEIIKKMDNKKLKITSSDKKVGTTILTLDKENRMVAFQNDTVTSVGKKFLNRSNYLKRVSMKSLTVLEEEGFKFCYNLEEIDFPSLEILGDSCFHTEKIKHLFLPNVRVVGNEVMWQNSGLETLEMENVQEIGIFSFGICSNLKELILPNVEKMSGSNFIWNLVEKAKFPKLKIVGNGFFEHADRLKKAYFPQLEVAGDKFIREGTSLIEIHVPALKKTGIDFLKKARKLTCLTLSSIKQLENSSLEEASEVQFFSAPNLKKYGTNVFKNNSSMKEEMQRICYSNRRKGKVKKRSLRREQCEKSTNKKY